MKYEMKHEPFKDAIYIKYIMSVQSRTYIQLGSWFLDKDLIV